MSSTRGSIDSSALAGVGYLVLGATLIQWTAAIVMPAFSVLGASAASGWRFLLGAVVLVVVTRPNLRRWTRRQWWGAFALGATTAFMNLCFYQAIARIPLGGAVAIEYLGPFCVAAFGKRTPRHLALVGLAALGVLALTRPGSGLHATGVLFAAGSGLGWAAYVFASKNVGATTTGLSGLAVSMSMGALLTLPFTLGTSARLAEHPELLGRLLVVSVMAIVLGFGAELRGLRRLRPPIAGVIMASDPAIAFLIGLVLLSQHVSPWDLLGLACVMVAGALVMLDSTVGVGELPQ